jgi:hypothetical protein
MAKAQDALSALLSADLNVTKSVFLKRLGVDLEVKAIDGKTLKQLQDQATHGTNLDELKFNALVIAKSCLSLNFGDAKLLEKYNASDAGDCVQKALLAGEMAKLVQATLEVSGFDDIAEQVRQAKN